MLLALTLALFVAPIIISVATHTPAAAAWYAASREPTGLAPHPGLVREPVVQVYAARTFGWRGAFGVHSWIVVKRANAAAYKRYEVVFWGGAPFVRMDFASPDAQWFGSRPDLLVDRRGEGVDALIDEIEAAVKSYPYHDAYRTWPAEQQHLHRPYRPQRAELAARSSGECDRQGLPAALGRIRTSAERYGVQVSLFGLLGVLVAPEEGFEINLLGLSLGADVAEPALRLPALGRVGPKASPH